MDINHRPDSKELGRFYSLPLKEKALKTATVLFCRK